LAKKRDIYRMTRQPVTPAALREYGELTRVRRPKGKFDPTGNWEHAYRMWVAGRPWQTYRGFMKLARTKEDGGGVRLNVSQTVVQGHQCAIHECEASITCSDDALATPLGWQVSAGLRELKGEDQSRYAGLRHSAEIECGKMAIHRGRRKTVRDVPKTYTANWCLFEAVQRLPTDASAHIEFTLFDELDKWKADHRLTLRGKTAIPFGKEEVPVHCFVQVGRGTLPREYFVDEQRRLLLVICGLEAYILDSQVDARHERIVKWLTRRGPR